MVHENSIKDWYAQRGNQFEPKTQLISSSRVEQEFNIGLSPKELEDQFFVKYKARFGRFAFEPIAMSPESQ